MNDLLGALTFEYIILMGHCTSRELILTAPFIKGHNLKVGHLWRLLTLFITKRTFKTVYATLAHIDTTRKYFVISHLIYFEVIAMYPFVYLFTVVSVRTGEDIRQLP